MSRILSNKRNAYIILQICILITVHSRLIINDRFWFPKTLQNTYNFTDLARSTFGKAQDNRTSIARFVRREIELELDHEKWSLCGDSWPWQEINNPDSELPLLQFHNRRRCRLQDRWKCILDATPTKASKPIPILIFYLFKIYISYKFHCFRSEENEKCAVQSIKWMKKIDTNFNR